MIDLINASFKKFCLPDISYMNDGLFEERRGGDEVHNRIDR
jgi:hypothetical protein